jgi:hypothetical protein
MDVILLPLVKADLPLTQALETMRYAERSGIVSERSNTYRLHSAASVVRGLNRKQRTLADLTEISSDVVEIKKVRVANLSSSQHESLDLNDLLGSLGSADNYGLIATGSTQGRTEALLFTRYERLRATLEPAPTNCYCSWDGCDLSVAPNSQCPVHGASPTCTS